VPPKSLRTVQGAARPRALETTPVVKERAEGTITRRGGSKTAPLGRRAVDAGPGHNAHTLALALRRLPQGLGSGRQRSGRGNTLGQRARTACDGEACNAETGRKQEPATAPERGTALPSMATAAPSRAVAARLIPASAPSRAVVARLIPAVAPSRAIVAPSRAVVARLIPAGAPSRAVAAPLRARLQDERSASAVPPGPWGGARSASSLERYHAPSCGRVGGLRWHHRLSSP